MRVLAEKRTVSPEEILDGYYGSATVVVTMVSVVCSTPPFQSRLAILKSSLSNLNALQIVRKPFDPVAMPILLNADYHDKKT
jgi:hypothetical protein